MPRPFSHIVHNEENENTENESIPLLLVNYPHNLTTSNDNNNNNNNNSTPVTLTLSDALVQFLSPLQLQGYTSQLIESCGTHHLHDLAAKITSESDVDKILGNHSSLQQRREFWKGICKWKKTKGKRGREQAKKSNNNNNNNNNNKSIVSSTSVHTNVELLNSNQVTVDKRFNNSNGCTPSQFMRQFAFLGNNSDNKVIEKDEINIMVKESGIISPCPNNCRHSCNNNNNNNNNNNLLNETDEIFLSASFTPVRSGSFSSSSLSALCGSISHSKKHLHREKLPLASLSVGLIEENIETDAFADEWRICYNDNNENDNTNNNDNKEYKTQEESIYSSISQSKINDTHIGESIQKCLMEHELLQENLRLSIEKSIKTYNEELLAVQEKVKLTFSEIKDNSNCIIDNKVYEMALKIQKESQLRVELHPINSFELENTYLVHNVQNLNLNQIINKIENPKILHNNNNNIERKSTNIKNKEESINNHNIPRNSLLVQTTEVSPLSINFGEEVIPSLSDMTTPDRGSRRNLERVSIRHSNSNKKNNKTNENIHSLLNKYSFETESTELLPINEEEINAMKHSIANENNNTNIEVLPSSLNNILNENITQNDNEEVIVSGNTRLSSEIALEHFGLQALIEEDSCTIPLPTSGIYMTNNERDNSHTNSKIKGIDSQVIDVDDFSSCSDTDKIRTLLHDNNNNNIIPIVDDDDDDDNDNNSKNDSVTSTHSIPVTMNNNNSNNFLSEEDYSILYTQLPRQRQRAESRCSSLSLTQDDRRGAADLNSFSFNITEGNTGLDWTEASSIAVDVQNLATRLHNNTDDQNIILNNNNNNNNNNEIEENNSIKNNITTITSTSKNHSIVPCGLPPLPVKNSVNITLNENNNKIINIDLDQLTPENVMNMNYDMLKKWCLQLGIRIPHEEKYNNDYNDCERGQQQQQKKKRNLNDRINISQQDENNEYTMTQGENSNGWMLFDNDNDIFTLCDNYDNNEIEKENDRLKKQRLENSNNNNTNNKFNHSISPHRYTKSRSRSISSNSDQTGTRTPNLQQDVDEKEWYEFQKLSIIEQMRESLRLFITRRTFMQEVIPSFFHRLPRFSGGNPYKRIRAADIMKGQISLTREQLEEHRRLAKKEEINEVVSCVITSLAAEAVENIERQAMSMTKDKLHTSENNNNNNISTNNISLISSSSQRRSESPKPNRTGAAQSGLTSYEQLLLMEPTDVQAAAAIVNADFPHISRHRVETLLEESGIPIIDAPRRVVFHNQLSQNNDLNATQHSAASHSPPTSELTPEINPSQLSIRREREVGGGQQSRQRFFKQRGWLKRAQRGR